MLMTHAVRTAACVLTACFLAGCANVWHPQTPEDPYENYNRHVFKFNLAVDRRIYRPIARAYDTVMPKLVQRRVNNFLGNVGEVSNIGNDVLQMNASWMLSDTGRLLVNSTLGVGGLFDVASNLGLEKHSQDFGLTMAKWGMQDSPYFLFPFLGPSTARDFLGGIVDYPLSVWTYVEPDSIRYAAFAFNGVQSRVRLLSTDKLVDQAFDPYIFVRDAYLQNRRSKIQKVMHGQQNPQVLEDIEAADPG